MLNLWQKHHFSFEINAPDQAFELFRRISRAIPINRFDGGSNLAGSFKFRFRRREDPRVVDRRMQSLLAMINDKLSFTTPKEASFLLFSLIKLRMPEDWLINNLVERVEQTLDQMTPKELALVLWSLARLNYPTQYPLS